MIQKLFKKNNESFICINCHSHVKKHPASSRDHCTECLYGLHVDINPGDRQNNCKGILKPIGLKIRNGKVQVVYDCQKCHKRVFCIIAEDDSAESVEKLVSMVW
jgi:DNA-directed RNA polymerase subunit RPC12/RpoP